MNNFVFIHINKTGGTSVGHALQIPFGHSTAVRKRDELGTQRWAKKFSFAFVRNPWDRAVSLYSYRLGRGDSLMPFPEWVEATFGATPPAPNLMEGPQLDWITDEHGRIIIDFVGRFERLAEDFSHICQSIGRDAVLPHLKASERSEYTDYFDDHTRQLISSWFAKDIEAFGYRFGG